MKFEGNFNRNIEPDSLLLYTLYIAEDEIEPLLELPSTPLSTAEILPGPIEAKLVEGNFYIFGRKGSGAFKDSIGVTAEIHSNEIVKVNFPINLPEGVMVKPLGSG